MENDGLNHDYLINIPFGVNLKTLLWILVYLLAFCFAQFLTPYLVKLSRHNVLKNVFTEILSGLPKPIQINIKYFHNFSVGKSQAYKLTGGPVARSLEEQGANETSLQFFTKLGLMAHFNQAGGTALLSYEEMDGFFKSLSGA